MKRVTVFGPESTGKTTLAKRLAEHFKTEWAPEFVREYMEKKKAPLDLKDVLPIVKGQITRQDEIASRANLMLILDTDVWMSAFYSEWYYRSCPTEVFRLAEKRRADLYLFTDVDVPWVPDPQRDMPQRREEMHGRCREFLRVHKLPYVDIKGGWKERFEKACGEISKLTIE